MDLTIIPWRGADQFPSEEARDALRNEGAILVRGLLSADDIATARRQVMLRLRTQGEYINLGKTQPNAAILVPEIGWLVAQPKIVDVFQQLLDGDARFTGHCDAHMNLLSGWHKDSGESVGGYFQGDYFAADDCRVFKAAVYLQDATPKDGLTVKLGSHRRAGHEGETVHVPSKAGDVVFFDVRLSHTGQLPDAVEQGIKALVRPLRKGRNEPALGMRLRELYWRAIRRRDRLSVFFTYGADNAFTRDFARANMVRQVEQARNEVVALPESLTRLLDQARVTMIKWD